MKKSNDIEVLITSRDVTCEECRQTAAKGAWIFIDERERPLCLSCADLDHLVYLPSGDAALTRRAKKHSILSAIVLDPKLRRRYQRRGLLVETEALEQAEKECLADNDLRARNRERQAIRRAKLDREYVEKFTIRIRELYPNCPVGRETEIAEHACLKYSGRVGRSARAKELHDKAIRQAVLAHVRHKETEYDALLAGGHERHAARARIEDEIKRVLREWAGLA